MKAPVEHVKVSARGREILIKIKRATGMEHWNEICRIALCKSLAIQSAPPKRTKSEDSNIEMDWKTFAGKYHQELSAMIISKAQKDNINTQNKNELADYLKDHLERGIFDRHKIKKIINNTEYIKPQKTKRII